MPVNVALIWRLLLGACQYTLFCGRELNHSLSAYAENIRRHCTKFIRLGDQMFGICGPLCCSVWIGLGFSINVFVDTNNRMFQSSKTKIERCRNLYTENHCLIRIMKTNNMHYFSNLCDKVFYI